MSTPCDIEPTVLVSTSDQNNASGNTFLSTGSAGSVMSHITPSAQTIAPPLPSVRLMLVGALVAGVVSPVAGVALVAIGYKLNWN